MQSNNKGNKVSKIVIEGKEGTEFINFIIDAESFIRQSESGKMVCVNYPEFCVGLPISLIRTNESGLYRFSAPENFEISLFNKSTNVSKKLPLKTVFFNYIRKVQTKVK